MKLVRGGEFSTCRELVKPVLTGRVGSPAAACSSLADFDVAISTGMVRQRFQSKCTGSLWGRVFNVPPPTGSSASGDFSRSEE